MIRAIIATTTKFEANMQEPVLGSLINWNHTNNYTKKKHSKLSIYRQHTGSTTYRNLIAMNRQLHTWKLKKIKLVLAKKSNRRRFSRGREWMSIGSPVWNWFLGENGGFWFTDQSWVCKLQSSPSCLWKYHFNPYTFLLFCICLMSYVWYMCCTVYSIAYVGLFRCDSMSLDDGLFAKLIGGYCIH